METKSTARPVMPGQRARGLAFGAVVAGVGIATMPMAQAQTAGPVLAQAASEQRIAFDIPAQDLSRAVIALANRASVQVLFDGSRLQNLRSSAVSGSMTVQDALARILEGTGMTYRFTGPATVTLVEMPRNTGGAAVLPPVTVQGQRQAETADGPVEGYVATRQRGGTKTDTPLLETPQSISVITRDQMSDQNAQTLNQALRYTAGVTPETRGAVATRYDMFTVRGFDAHKYWNGLKQQDLYYIAPQVDPYLLERVEVIKGPSSTLYGQSPAGGIVNQVSKRPTETSLNEIGIEGGSNNHMLLTGDFSGKVDPEGKLLYRVTAVGLSEDGQINMTENQRLAFAPSVTLRPDDTTSLTLYGLLQTDPKGNSYGGIPPEGTVLSNPFGRIPVDFYDGDPNFEKFVRQQQALGYEFEKQLSDVWSFRSNARALHATTAYDSVYANGLDTDGRTLNRGTASSRESSMSYLIDNSVEARLNTGPVKHTVVAGFDYQHIQGAYAVGFGSAPTLDVFNPVYGQTITAPVRQRNEIEGDQYGFYLQDQMKLGGFILTLGGRHDDAKQDTTAPSGVVTKQDDSAWTGKIGLTYLFDNGFAPYVSYAEAFTPQSGTEFSGKPYEPEGGKQYEVGMKYQPPGTRSLYTAAVFDLTRTNLQTGDPAHPGYSITTGEAKSRGLELEAKFGVTDQLDLIGAYTYLDTEVTKDNNGLQGKRLAAVPEHQASTWAVYRMPQKSDYNGLRLGAGVRYTGETVNSSNRFSVPAFTLVDAMIGYDLGTLSNSFAGMDFTINVKNVFDKTYVASCYYGETWCAYGYERTITAGLRYRW